MSKLSEKTTIYLEPHVKKFLQLLAVRRSKALSELINNHFADQMSEFEKRAAQSSLADDWKFIKLGKQ